MTLLSKPDMLFFFHLFRGKASNSKSAGGRIIVLFSVPMISGGGLVDFWCHNDLLGFNLLEWVLVQLGYIFDSIPSIWIPFFLV